MYIYICTYIGNSVEALDQIVAFDVEETKLLQTPHKVPCMSCFLEKEFYKNSSLFRKCECNCKFGCEFFRRPTRCHICHFFLGKDFYKNSSLFQKCECKCKFGCEFFKRPTRCHIPPKKLLGSVVSTLYTPFCCIHPFV